MKKRGSRNPYLYVLAAALALGTTVPAFAAPAQMPYFGRLQLNDADYTGVLSAVQVRIFNVASSSGDTGLVWMSSTLEDIPVADGRFSLVLTGGTPQFGTDALTSNDLWIEFTIDGNKLLPRQRLRSQPFAVEAHDAQALDGMMPADFLQMGDSATVQAVTASGSASVNAGAKIGWGDTDCDMDNAGVVRYVSASKLLEYCDGASWQEIDPAAPLTSLNWNDVGNIPGTIADGTDDSTEYLYYPGIGLYAQGAGFYVDVAQFQRRVGTECPSGQAMRTINSDGTAVCAPVGNVYTVSASGGMQLSGNALGLKPCTTGQLLKWSAGAWNCANDTNNTTFGSIGGSMSDGQISDALTVGWSKDADTVDGHHYSPVWDSTDSETLQGLAPDQFATSSAISAIDAATGGFPDPALTPAEKTALCQNSLPTKVCKRSVHMAGADPSMDPYSMMLLSGGTWSYNASEDRCEYQGGIETPAPEQCAKDLMPSWMDTTDLCGGFRQSTWDTRVWYAVSKSNVWDPAYNYECPAGFDAMTVEQAKQIFKGANNAGAKTYQNQCGWQSNVWKNQTKTYFRYKDSGKSQYYYKDSTHADGFGLPTSGTLTNFAGMVCISKTPAGPLDWMLTEDLCGGFKQSEFDSRFYYAVARRNVYEYGFNYQCPTGFKWATTAEAYAVFKTTLNQGTVYNGKCGWTGYDMQANGMNRYYFRFKDSFEGLATGAYKHSGNGEMYTVQFDDKTLTEFAGIVCMKEDPTVSPTDWMDTSDYCGGFRQSSWDPNFYFAVSKSTTWNPALDYQCPAGYTWATGAEIDAAFTTSNPSSDQRVYGNQCGWSSTSGQYWNGVQRVYFRIKPDVTGTNRYMNAADADSYRGTTSGATSEFAGIVCKKTGTPAYPPVGTTEWMETSDDCKGFRESTWNARIRFAVSRQNIFKPGYTYTCPTGYHWAASTEVDNLMVGSSTNYYKYHGQCGWSAYNWENRYRQYFFFSDTWNTGDSGTKRYFDAAHAEPTLYSTFGSTPMTSFAGIVCLSNSPPADQTAWMDKTDNCGGFRQSAWDPRVYYAIARNNTWAKNNPETYVCPPGFHWMTTNEANVVFRLGAEYNTANIINEAQRSYRGECGWTTSQDYTVPNNQWHGLLRHYFRFADSNLTLRYKHVDEPEAYITANITDTTSNFAGILCMKDAAAGALDWVDTSDNCGGMRTSSSHPNVLYVVSKSSVWDRDRTYACPAGYKWANSGEVAFNNNPSFPANTYWGECGWSGSNWNPLWQMGCSSYGQAGCGSGTASPSPTMGQIMTAASDFAFGCTQCQNYTSTCQSSGTTSGPDGKCGGIDEPRWRNGQELNDCYWSPNSVSGTPKNIVSGTYGDHCYNGVCCGNSEIQGRTLTRRWFRFADSKTNNTAKDAADNDNQPVENYTGQDQFAGIVCIKL
ncbi:MAG: hypothetical protein HUU55_01235 [Myxococcales bacterium]|nr:hypothetical protein [Myxococcales bacterium]